MYQFGEFAKETLEQLSGQGVFLTVKCGDKTNVMTIGWGSLSQYWGEEIFIAPVRASRYTLPLLEKADAFAISVPAKNTMAEALKICGTLSGRDGNKFEKAGLKIKAGEALDVPLVDGCAVYYECKKRFTAEMDLDAIDPALRERWYGSGDAHTLFFGKIVSAHR